VRKPTLVMAGLVLVAVTLTYSNHFRNSFHFDDFHTITANVFVRSLANIPRFFTNADTSSVLPSNRGWRPLVTTSLAIDYWLGKGYTPPNFQLSTFFWFLVQLVAMYGLFAAVLERTRPGPRNRWIAWLAVAVYGLHPAMAETVNYIIQRADLMSTCGVVAALAVYAQFPRSRRWALYLIPAVAALLCKPPAMVFPLLLFAYIYYFEKPGNVRAAAIDSVPAVVLSAVFMWLQSAMTPKTFSPGAASASAYLITQPYVAFRYFSTLFMPLNLNADTDLGTLPSVFTPEALAGFAFLGALLYAIYAASRGRATRPIAFGLVWFVVALAPTSLFPLAEVENDHRMFFPFVGLVLAVVWGAVLFLEHRRLVRRAPAGGAAAVACVLVLLAVGTRQRNEVWRSEDTLWADVARKSPHNGRGLMNYGLTLLAKGEFPAAIATFERAAIFTPDYPALEINLGIAYGAVGRDADAEHHLLRAEQLAPSNADAHHFYARWLRGKGRIGEARRELEAAIAVNAAYMDARYLLLEVYADQHQWAELKALAADTRRMAPDDPAVDRYVNRAGDVVVQTAGSSGGQITADSLLDESLRQYRNGDYRAAIQAARDALRLRPQFAEAYNNIAAAYQSMGQWDEAIQAAREALRIRPDFQLAKNNLAWSESQKKLYAPARR